MSRSMSNGHGPSAYNGAGGAGNSFSNGNLSDGCAAEWYVGNDPLGRTLYHWGAMLWTGSQARVAARTFYAGWYHSVSPAGRQAVARTCDGKAESDWTDQLSGSP